MPITTPKELVVSMLSELRHGAERSQTIYEEFVGTLLVAPVAAGLPASL